MKTNNNIIKKKKIVHTKNPEKKKLTTEQQQIKFMQFCDCTTNRIYPVPDDEQSDAIEHCDCKEEY